MIIKFTRGYNEYVERRLKQSLIALSGREEVKPLFGFAVRVFYFPLIIFTTRMQSCHLRFQHRVINHQINSV